MDDATILSNIMQKAFQIADDSVPLGMDVAAIKPTLAKLPGGPTTGLESLFESTWPAEGFFVGRIELFGHERINYEHEELLPSCLIVQHGFLGIGGDGAGTIFAYCIEDQKVYLIYHEDVEEDTLRPASGGEMEVTPENIKSISEETWDSMGKLLEWAYAELLIIEKENQDNQ